MIYVGIDDTDIVGSPGTNQLARAIARETQRQWRCLRIVRHQLFVDPRIPYTSQNGSASLLLQPRGELDIEGLIDDCRRVMRDWFVEGSDPGLCIAFEVPAAIEDFGRQCGVEVMTQAAAQELAAAHSIHLEGLGGTCDGIIGALAAVGLAGYGNDGRIVQWGEWPDDLSGEQPIGRIVRRNVRVQEYEAGDLVVEGNVQLGKRLRPNLRGGRAVLFVNRIEDANNRENYQALKLP